MSTAKLSVLREEAKRKTIHLCGIAIPVLYLFLQRELLILGFLLAFLLAGSIEWLRFRGVVSLPCLREKEHKKIGGYVFFLIGAFISIILFEKSVAIVAILMLAIGDAASALAGGASLFC